MEYREIRYEAHGHTRVICFDRPEQRNCVGPRTHLELIDAWTRFRDDDDALVAIVTGAGDKAFCAGGDLKAPELLPDTPEEQAAHARGERPGLIGPSRWTNIYKPIIAAVNGDALAGGLEWACFADIRIAERHARFGVTCRRWNVGLGDGGTQRLPRIIGMGRAMDLIITGRVIDAVEAERIGLVNEVVECGQSLERALELAAYIATLPQTAMRTDKEAAVRGFGLPIDEGLRIEAECFNRLIDGREITTGFERFASRDHPDLQAGRDPVTPGIDR